MGVRSWAETSIVAGDREGGERPFPDFLPYSFTQGYGTDDDDDDHLFLSGCSSSQKRNQYSAGESVSQFISVSDTI